MANFSTLAVPAQLTPLRVAGQTNLRYNVDPSNLASYPLTGDTIQLGSLPPGARIMDAFLRSDTTNSSTTGVGVKLRMVYAGTTTDLTTTLSTNTASSIGMLSTFAAPKVQDTTSSTVMQLLVTGGSLTAPGAFEVLLGFDLAKPVY